MGSVWREVLTLQLGHYSNFVGSHWWNIQDSNLYYDAEVKDPYCEISNNVLFREGQTQHGQTTYTPRLILLDLKGSLNSLKQEGVLYEGRQTEPTVTWEGGVSVHKEEPVKKNQFLRDLDRHDGQRHTDRNLNGAAYQAEQRAVPQRPLDLSQRNYQLEGSVTVWSDYLRVHLHPKTVSVVHQYNHEGDSDRFEAFGQGEKLFQDPAFLDDFEDRLHFYVEECDYLQGFHLLCDLQDGFSGAASKLLELLKDEYGGRGIFTSGVAPTSHMETSPVKDIYRLLNTVMGIVNLSNRSSIFCPLSLNENLLRRRPASAATFPHLIYNASVNYHSSAVLASALDTLTLPHRLHSSNLSLVQLANALNVSGRKMVMASASLPFPLQEGSTLPDALFSHQGEVPWRPLSPCGELRDSRCFSQSVVLRGISREQQVSNLPPGEKPPSVLHACPTGDEVLGKYIYSHFPATLSAVHVAQTPSKVLTPYPQLFTAAINRQGHLAAAGAPSGGGVESMPVLSALQSSPVLHNVLRNLHKDVTCLDLRKFNSFLSAGTEVDDFKDALEELRTLSQCYKMNFDLDESEDESDME
ncbi:protein misato homolog 1 [Callorhinchus milii]|uniref:protein misato homolog 1 n=1 Tax=Callorhinchus milii TaxID=7868 RepID=UPI001C3FC933|nr:protein misato homolog 1 [Callorhinchus milii]